MRIGIIILFLAAIWPGTWNDSVREESRNLNRAIQGINAYVDTTQHIWIQNYNWLMQQEMKLYANDTFSLAWKFTPKNLTIEYTKDPVAPILAVYNPTYPSMQSHPTPNIYDLSGRSCMGYTFGAQYLLDLDLEFYMNYNYEVISFRPLVRYGRDGFKRLLIPRYTDGFDCRRCVVMDLKEDEKEVRARAGRRYLNTLKFESELKQREKEIYSAIDSFMVQTYGAFIITGVEHCHQVDRDCYFNVEPAARKAQSYGLIHTETGPVLLHYAVEVDLSQPDTILIDIVDIQN